MSVVTDLHDRFALLLILLGAVGAGWTVLGLRRRGGIPAGVRAMLVLTERLDLVQGLFGLTPLSRACVPATCRST